MKIALLTQIIILKMRIVMDVKWCLEFLGNCICNCDWLVLSGFECNGNVENSNSLKVEDVDWEAIQMSEIRPNTSKCPKPNEYWCC